MVIALFYDEINGSIEQTKGQKTRQ
jgi:hypothetical protein